MGFGVSKDFKRLGYFMRVDDFRRSGAQKKKQLLKSRGPTALSTKH